MWTKNIAFVDPNAIVVFIGHNFCYNNEYDEADFICENTDRVNARNVNEMLTNALANLMWSRYGEGKLDDYLCENETFGDGKLF